MRNYSAKKLHFDILNAYGKRESYEEYIQFEKNKVSQINVLFGEYVKLRAQFLEIYDRLHKELLEYGRGLISQQIYEVPIIYIIY